MREEFRDSELVENHSKPPVKVGHDCQPKARSKRLQSFDDLRIKFPYAGFGKVFVGNLEKIISVQILNMRGDVSKDKLDKFSPPSFVIIFARTLDWWTL